MTPNEAGAGKKNDDSKERTKKPAVETPDPPQEMDPSRQPDPKEDEDDQKNKKPKKDKGKRLGESDTEIDDETTI